MNLLKRDSFDLLAHAASPCLSLYQPTHRHYPDNQQDAIRFRNLVANLGDSLRMSLSEEEVQKLLDPFESLANDVEFWRHTLDGLAVFAAPGLFEAFVTQRPVPELTIMADSFHTKPLRRFLQTTDRYQILALSRTSIRLLEGDRDHLDEIELAPGVPKTLTEALGEELTGPHLTVASYGGTGPGSVSMRHGHSGKSEELDIDTERFFRTVDRAVCALHSKPSGLPLILAALPQHHGDFRALSVNPQLVPEGIGINPESKDLDELRSAAWSILEPGYRSRLAILEERFGQARAKQLGSDGLAEVARAASEGRVETLLVEADRHLPGRLDTVTGEVESGDLQDPGVDDMLDDLCDLVEGKGGEVLVVPRDLMPAETGLAAIFRY